jgi:hypothetical protein
MHTLWRPNPDFGEFQMRNGLMALVFATASLALFSTEASAYICRAGSPTGSWGRGWHNYSLGYAKRRALMECAVRTPRGYTCYITGCV